MQTCFPGMGMTLDEKVDKAVETLRLFAPADGSPYYGAFSGGKDSCCIKELARFAGVPVVWHYSVTTVDPPELVRFIRREHPDVVFDRPARPMWALVGKKGLPRPHVRWCCERYKESKGSGRVIIGVRAAESPRRAKRWRIVTPFRKHGETVQMVSPILYWTDADVWAFHARQGIAHCELYDQGFTRLGCVMCPMAGPTGMRRDAERWPGIARLWRKGSDAYWQRRHDAGQLEHTRLWRTADGLWDWWLKAPRMGKAETCEGLGLFL